MPETTEEKRQDLEIAKSAEKRELNSAIEYAHALLKAKNKRLKQVLKTNEHNDNVNAEALEDFILGEEASLKSIPQINPSVTNLLPENFMPNAPAMQPAPQPQMPQAQPQPQTQNPTLGQAAQRFGQLVGQVGRDVVQGAKYVGNKAVEGVKNVASTVGGFVRGLAAPRPAPPPIPKPTQPIMPAKPAQIVQNMPKPVENKQLVKV